MPYTPDATDTTQPADGGVKASTAAAEFRALKSYIKNNILGGTVAFTGNPTVPLLAAADATAKIASAAFVQQEITRLTGLVVNSAGNVGIGTNSPAAKLDVAGSVAVNLASAGQFVAVRGAAVSSANLVLQPNQTSGNAWWLTAKSSGTFHLGAVGGSEPAAGAVIIDTTGKVSVGGTPLYAKFQAYSSGANDFVSELAQGITDGNFRLYSTNGDTGNAAGTIMAKLILNYSGVGEAAGVRFLRGGGALDGALTFATNAAERVRVDSAGNVGIGTTIPSAKLDIVANSATLALRDPRDGASAPTATTKLSFYRHFGVNEVASIAAVGTSISGNPLNEAALVFSTANGAAPAEVMRLDTSGNLLLRTTVSSGTGLSMRGVFYQQSADGGSIGTVSTSNANGETSIGAYRATGGLLTFYTANTSAAMTERMRIDSSGNVGVGTTSPTTRLDVRSSGTYPFRVQGTTATAGGGLQIFNDAGTNGITAFTYGSTYVGGSILNIGAGGSAIIANGTAALAITTDAGNTSPLSLGSNNTERLRIKASGGVVFIPTGAPASPQAGEVYYDSTTNKHYGFNGSVWNAFY